MQLLSSDGQLIQLSDAAARQSVTLQGAEDVGDGAPVPVPLLDSGRLQRITALLDQLSAHATKGEVRCSTRAYMCNKKRKNK